MILHWHLRPRELIVVANTAIQMPQRMRPRIHLLAGDLEKIVFGTSQLTPVAVVELRGEIERNLINFRLAVTSCSQEPYGRSATEKSNTKEPFSFGPDAMATCTLTDPAFASIGRL